MQRFFKFHKICSKILGNRCPSFDKLYIDREVLEMIYRFNQTMTYIESVLDSEIDKKKIQQLSGYSYSMFSRLFSILAEMTLSEYIRKRRLSEAVNDLKTTSQKIVDIAMKYGYDSADSFSSAFKKFHGVTPSEVRRGMTYEVFPKL